MENRHKSRQHSLPLRVMMAGGITGGHLFPGIAIAQEFVSRNPANQALFVSLGNSLERRALKEAGYQLATIPVSGIKGRGVKNQIMSVLGLPAGLAAAFLRVIRFKPHLVIGMGGYSAGPVVVAAWMAGVPVVIHEQNVMPGITNRMLSRIASRVYVSFEASKTAFSRRKVVFSGNPVRHEFIRGRNRENAVAETEGTKNEKPFVVFIAGGSQGAHAINIAVIEALNAIPEPGRYFFIHQCGAADAEMVKKAYAQKGFNADVRAFFTDMARQYDSADLLICRSGATTVAEVTAMGKGAIFVPFPHAADNHQVLNAASLANEGAAEIILQEELECELLAQRIVYYSQHPAVLAKMGKKAERHGKPDAAGVIVDDCYLLFEDSLRDRMAKD
ncbi:MAG: undecaprenyldiphospho-muramoylpentapeptide beta-N-acetylglucosaminyltransferase [Desulfobacterales bacterium]